MIPLYQGFNQQDLYHIVMTIYSAGHSSLGDFSDKIHHRYKYTTQENHTGLHRYRIKKKDGAVYVLDG